jgi:hypothetical protein
MRAEDLKAAPAPQPQPSHRPYRRNSTNAHSRPSLSLSPPRSRSFPFPVRPVAEDASLIEPRRTLASGPLVGLPELGEEGE